LSSVEAERAYVLTGAVPLRIVGTTGLLSIAAVVTRVRWRVFGRRVGIARAVTLAAFVGLSALVWGAPQPHVAALFVVVACCWRGPSSGRLGRPSRVRSGRASSWQVLCGWWVDLE
jgi:hypothetical protein